MMITYIFDKEHNVVVESDYEIWEKWISNHENKIVRQETIGDIWVSTVFLGIDHNFSGSSNPVLFETMLFAENGFMLEDEYQERCETYEQALKMHEEAIKKAKQLQGIV